MNALEALTEYYTHHNEDARFISRHGQVEFLTTIRYIEKYLRPGDRILEIGAGTGRYSHYFARKGYPVDAIELIEHNIDVFRQQTQMHEKISILQGNATNLDALQDQMYDVTLLLGPMYHLFTENEKKLALREAMRVTRPGGLLFIAYCMSDPSVWGYGFGKKQIKRLIQENLLDPETFETTSTPNEVFVLYRREEIDHLAENLPAKRLHLIGTDMYTQYFRAQIDEMDEETFQIYLQFHFSICERPDMTGFSHHTLDILQKQPIIPENA